MTCLEVVDACFSGCFGFKERAFFKAEEGADSAPKVNFGTGTK
jgi:hypothetical protein